MLKEGGETYVGPMPPLSVSVQLCVTADLSGGAHLPCYHQVIALAHARDCLDDLGFVILDDFDSLQVLPTFVRQDELP